MKSSSYDYLRSFASFIFSLFWFIQGLMAVDDPLHNNFIDKHEHSVKQHNLKSFIQHTPDEILVEIFAHLDQDSCQSAHLVCQRWHGILSDGRVYRNIMQACSRPQFESLIMEASITRLIEWAKPVAPYLSQRLETYQRYGPRLNQSEIDLFVFLNQSRENTLYVKTQAMNKALFPNKNHQAFEQLLEKVRAPLMKDYKPGVSRVFDGEWSARWVDIAACSRDPRDLEPILFQELLNQSCYKRVRKTVILLYQKTKDSSYNPSNSVKIALANVFLDEQFYDEASKLMSSLDLNQDLPFKINELFQMKVALKQNKISQACSFSRALLDMDCQDDLRVIKEAAEEWYLKALDRTDRSLRYFAYLMAWEFFQRAWSTFAVDINAPQILNIFLKIFKNEKEAKILSQTLEYAHGTLDQLTQYLADWDGTEEDQTFLYSRMLKVYAYLFRFNLMSTTLQKKCEENIMKIAEHLVVDIIDDNQPLLTSFRKRSLLKNLAYFQSLQNTLMNIIAPIVNDQSDESWPIILRLYRMWGREDEVRQIISLKMNHCEQLDRLGIYHLAWELVLRGSKARALGLIVGRLLVLPSNQSANEVKLSKADLILNRIMISYFIYKSENKYRAQLTVGKQRRMIEKLIGDSNTYLQVDQAKNFGLALKGYLGLKMALGESRDVLILWHQFLDNLRPKWYSIPVQFKYSLFRFLNTCHVSKEVITYLDFLNFSPIKHYQHLPKVFKSIFVQTYRSSLEAKV